jgi:hypothetical protein
MHHQSSSLNQKFQDLVSTQKQKHQQVKVQETIKRNIGVRVN